MVSGRARKNSSAMLVAGLLLLGLSGGCSIGRVYKGGEFDVEPASEIVEGTTTKSEILRTFGPPIHIQRQYDGDLFIYAFFRRNSSRLQIREPLITNMTFFSYTRVQQRKDHLVVLFDKDGVVKSFGFSKGTDELTFF